jgi:hypothetical protein
MSKRFHESKGQESRDSGMMPSGSGSFANMPQETVMRAYPTIDNGMPENLNDSISGIDNQIKSDNSKKHAHIQPEKI